MYDRLPAHHVPNPSGGDRSDRTVIFAPTTLLTVTIEADFNDREELHIHAGGQGFWVARMMSRLGTPVLLSSPFGGDTGEVLRQLVVRENVDLAGIDVTSSNGSYVHDRRGGERREICCIPGERLTRHQLDDYYNSTVATALCGCNLALTGQFPAPVVPSSVYRRLAADLRHNNCQVLADLSGDDLQAALQGGLDVLCVSDEQLLKDGYASQDSVTGLVDGMRTLQQAGADNVIVHRGPETTLACIGETLLQIKTPRFEPLDHRGGGDTFFAMLAVGFKQNRPFEEILKLAASAGSLNVTRHGLGTGHLADIEALSSRVEVAPLKSH